MSEFYSEAEAREIIRQSVVDDWRNARIEDAAKAIYVEMYSEEFAPDVLKPHTSVMCAARAALAVFEKALGEGTVTPTDAQKRLDRIAGFIDAADDGDEPPTLREIYLIARGRA